MVIYIDLTRTYLLAIKWTIYDTQTSREVHFVHGDCVNDFTRSREMKVL